ncbi:MAG: hypothetical protein JHC98_04630 [Thermoleophilaceae bacterium]|nr:hypothetical protein [Thermoleophilaceae bacterium]
MSAALKLAAFAGLLLLVFVASIGVGRALDPEKPTRAAESEHADEGEGAMSMSGGAAGAHAVRGLAVEDHGVRLIVETPELMRGAREQLRFRIVDTSGATVRDFTPTHTKPMHLIVVRRDLTGFQHLHPQMEADGTWSAAVSLPQAGSYRLFADFLREGEPVTLASDLRVDGESKLKPLPAPAAAATDDGYRVRLSDSDSRPGKATSLRFEVSRDGRPVEVEKYLGADGHLVALRDGDLAFLHVHPEEHAGAPGEIMFEATFPTAGAYRLFLQFKDSGRVQTAAFTEEVK